MAGFKEILSHSKNYLIGNIATRGLAFISIPIYTRILTEHEYGVYALFFGVYTIFSGIMTLCTDNSIGRYNYEKTAPDVFREFVGTSAIVSIPIFILTSTLLFLFAPQLSQRIGLEVNLIYLIIPLCLTNIISLTFEQVFGPQKRSKLIAIFSLVKAYAGFILSAGLILLYDSDKYYGYVLGQIAAGVLMAIYAIKMIRPYIQFIFRKDFLKYILSFSVPTIPYVLSGVIIEQFGKIAIGSNLGAEDTGFYALAVTIASLTGIIATVTHQAWYPYYFEYMNSANYKQHDIDLNRIFRITLLAALGISLLSNEIIYVLAKDGYDKYMYLVPIITLGLVFYQGAYIYLRNVSFVKKTLYMSVIVFTSAFVNIILNIILLPLYGAEGVAIAFLISYVAMYFIGFFISKFALHCYTTPLKLILKPIAIYLPFMAAYYPIQYLPNYMLILSAKVVVLILFAIVIFWNEKETLKQLKNRLSNKT